LFDAERPATQAGERSDHRPQSQRRADRQLKANEVLNPAPNALPLETATAGDFAKDVEAVIETKE